MEIPPSISWTDRRGYAGLSAEQEIELIRAWQERGDVNSRNRLINAFMPLAAKIVMKSCGKGPGAEGRRRLIDDMMSEASIGLMKAADRFRVEHGFRFSTYAQWWVRSEVNSFIMESHGIVKSIVTADHKRLFFKLGHQMNEVERNLRNSGQYESMDQVLHVVAEKMGMPVSLVRDGYNRIYVGDASLNVRVSDEDGAPEVIDITPSDDAGPEEILVAKDSRRRSIGLISEALTCLTERERDIVCRRKLTEENPATLEELGLKYGITRERIRQLEQKALQKIEKHVRRNQESNQIP